MPGSGPRDGFGRRASRMRAFAGGAWRVRKVPFSTFAEATISNNARCGYLGSRSRASRRWLASGLHAADTDDAPTPRASSVASLCGSATGRSLVGLLARDGGLIEQAKLAVGFELVEGLSPRLRVLSGEERAWTVPRSPKCSRVSWSIGSPWRSQSGERIT